MPSLIALFKTVLSDVYMFLGTTYSPVGRGGGGVHSENILVGCVLAQPKIGGLMSGTAK